MRVFVSIAAYRDPLLQFTLSRARFLASDPARLHFTVIDQCQPDAAFLTSTALAPARLTYLRIDSQQSRGACWARSIAMSHYEGEDWFFQLDSHMDFEPRWDERLIAQAQALREQTGNFVMSSYPRPFEVRKGRVLRPAFDKGVLVHAVASAENFEPNNPLLQFQAHRRDESEPVEGFSLGAGCLFAPGHYIEAFPYDPYYYFQGEEQALALRLYTHGWSIFHVPDLPVYHLYARDAVHNELQRPLHWDASEDLGRAQPSHRLDELSKDRLRALVNGQSLGVFGLGSIRNLNEFAAFSGIDYQRGSVEPRAFAGPGC